MGQGQNNDKKTDKKLESPQNVTPVPNQKDITEKDIKTRDGRTLRQFNEDPELRPDDSVTIELRPVDDVCVRYNLGPEALQNAANDPNNPPGGPLAAQGAGGGNPLSALSAAAGAANAAEAPARSAHWAVQTASAGSAAPIKTSLIQPPAQIGSTSLAVPWRRTS